MMDNYEVNDIYAYYLFNNYICDVVIIEENEIKKIKRIDSGESYPLTNLSKNSRLEKK